jgi:CheY-like chemotaxis protein
MPEIARRYGGAGLGLVFVKRIAKAMGGDLTIASAPERGSRFRLTIAADRIADVPKTGRKAKAPVALPEIARVPSVKVLCVEDNPYGRVVLNTILTELGHRADFVGTGEAAVVAAGRGGHDFVLMDVTRPGIDGIEATRRIRALGGRAGEVPIVGITGRTNAADERAGRAAGMNGYLAKPVSPSALSQLIEQLVLSPTAT